jgi:hypothetical protein
MAWRRREVGGGTLNRKEVGTSPRSLRSRRRSTATTATRILSLSVETGLADDFSTFSAPQWSEREAADGTRAVAPAVDCVSSAGYVNDPLPLLDRH